MRNLFWRSFANALSLVALSITVSSFSGLNISAACAAEPGSTDDMLTTGNELYKQKKYVEARAFFRNRLNVLEKRHGNNSPQILGALSDVVKASCAGEYCVDASPELLRMAQIRLATYGPQCRELPANWQMLGETKEKHGKYKEAVPYFERAVAAQKLINSKSKSKDSLDILFAMNLARALEKSGEKAKAQKLYKSLEKDALSRGLKPDDQLVRSIVARSQGR